MRGPLHDGDRAAQAANGLRHLDSHRTAAQHQQASRDRLHAGDLAICPDALEFAQAGNGRHDRVRAVGQHDVIRGVADSVHLHHARAREPAAAAKQSYAAIGQPALLAGVGVVRDHEVAPGERRADVDFGLCRRLTRGVDGLAGAKQRLRRNARPVGALAAHQFALDERDPQAAFGQRAGAVFAWRAAADDDDVVVVHVGSSVPACSAAMYSAYQSGQFGSVAPMRFSCWPCAASARRSALARSLAEQNEVTPESMRPGSRVVTSCSSQTLPSGSLNVAREE